MQYFFTSSGQSVFSQYYTIKPTNKNNFHWTVMHLILSFFSFQDARKFIQFDIKTTIFRDAIFLGTKASFRHDRKRSISSSSPLLYHKKLQKYYIFYFVSLQNVRKIIQIFRNAIFFGYESKFSL